MPCPRLRFWRRRAKDEKAKDEAMPVNRESVTTQRRDARGRPIVVERTPAVSSTGQAIWSVRSILFSPTRAAASRLIHLPPPKARTPSK